MITNNDKIIFKLEIKKANPIKLLAITKFIENSSLLPPTDKFFYFTHIGMRCDKLLKNVVKNKSFED